MWAEVRACGEPNGPTTRTCTNSSTRSIGYGHRPGTGLRQLSSACIYIIYAVWSGPGKEFRNLAGGEGYRDKAMTHFMTSSACCGWESHNFHVPSDFEVL